MFSIIFLLDNRTLCIMDFTYLRLLLRNGRPLSIIYIGLIHRPINTVIAGDCARKLSFFFFFFFFIFFIFFFSYSKPAGRLAIQLVTALVKTLRRAPICRAPRSVYELDFSNGFFNFLFRSPFVRRPPTQPSIPRPAPSRRRPLSCRHAAAAAAATSHDALCDGNATIPEIRFNVVVVHVSPSICEPFELYVVYTTAADTVITFIDSGNK